MNSAESNARFGDVAIIGIAGRFPGAENVDRFWQNLKDGVESVSVFSDQELDDSGVSRAARADSHYVPARAILDGAELFDAAFFGCSPREAEIMDPQHRLFLESCSVALESAGYESDKYGGRIGVYAGTSMDTYLISNLYPNSQLIEQFGAFQTMLGNDKDFLTTRVSYKLNLTGPSVDVQTACSTSLVAVHLACQSLINGECDMALAGGVSVKVPQRSGYLYQEGGITSPDGHCRAFDRRAQGFVGGNGVGVVLLRRLSDALIARDHVLAVIKGSAMNNDGRSKVGYTAPSINGQAEVIAEALSVAGADPRSISLVEAHGSGTPLGDSVEVAALVRVFGKSPEDRGTCAIGSVKTNIGHLDAASGVASLIKAVLALEHKVLPPSLNFEDPNPKLDLPNTPFYVAAKARPWTAGEKPRRAGVSSFGIGGTNVHLILEEAPAALASGPASPGKLLILSAHTDSALEKVTDNLAGFLRENPKAQIADVAYTLQVGRRDMRHRRMLVCRERKEALQALEHRDTTRIVTSYCESPDRRVVFMFPGQGVQHVDMGLALYQSERLFREQVSLCADLLSPTLGFDIRTVLYPTPARRAEAMERLEQTSVIQPALFVIEYALAKLWMAWGLTPEAMIGYSIGEYVAACLAGVFSLPDALQVIAARGQMMQALPAGAMLSVALASDKVQALLDGGISLSGINGPRHCVISGPIDSVARLEGQLAKQGVACRYLHTSHAFHSSMMAPVVVPFAEYLGRVSWKEPKIPFVSNLTGTWVGNIEAQNPQYWVRHLQEPVQFSEGLKTLLMDPGQILLEVGPGRSLSTLAKQQDVGSGGHAVMSSLRDPRQRASQSDEEFLLDTLGRLWLRGVNIDWSTYSEGKSRARVRMPTYPFDRQRHWVAPRQPNGGVVSQAAPANKVDQASQFYIPTWTSSRPAASLDAARRLARPAGWLLFVDSCGIGSHMARRLSKAGQRVTIVTPGETFVRLDDSSFSVNPRHAEDYRALIRELRRQDRTPEYITHLWSVIPVDPAQQLDAAFEGHMDLGFYSLLFLAQALASEGVGEDISLGIVTNNMQDVAGDHVLCPEKATVLGPCRVISQELPNITCRSVDLLLPLAGSWQDGTLVDSLVAELAGQAREPVVALRGGRVWVQTYEPVVLPEPRISSRLRDGGVYLITGGLGGIGLAIAEDIARTVHAKLVLVGRSHFPDRDERDRWLSTHGDQDEVSKRIRQVELLERLGADVLIARADVADASQMRAVIAQACERFGTVHGVVHAAGIAGTHMIRRASRDSAAAVLAPKVQGTLVLNALLERIPLDFFVLCSSQSSILGGVAGIDYCAANAFLDAFAHQSVAIRETYTVAINWDRWLDVGMALDTPKPTWPKGLGETRPGHYLGHPWLDQLVAASGDQITYVTRLSTGRHWVVDEHRIGGRAVMPGTGYLELARAAFQQTAMRPATAMREVTFLAPLVVHEGHETMVHTTLSPKEGVFEFRIASQLGTHDSEGLEWTTHSLGTIHGTQAMPAVRHVLADIISRCGERIAPEEGYYKGLGPRWRNIQWICHGKNEALACLELPETFSADLAELQLHPALVDMSAGILADVCAGDGAYAPFRYGSIVINAPVGGRIYSYAMYKGDERPKPEMLVFDVVIMNEEGVELVSIVDYAMRRIHDTPVRLEGRGGSAATRVEDDVLAGRLDRASPEQPNPVGITSSEGVEAFRRILSSSVSPQVVVSAQDFSTVVAEHRAFNVSSVLEALEKTPRPKSANARPEVGSAYVAPRTDAERAVARIFQEVLGGERVGVHDNFFELGGDSLIALQLLSRLRQAFDVELPVQSLFEQPTVAESAAAIEALVIAQVEALSEDEASSS